MKLPKFLQPYLASYDLSKLNGRSPGVKKEIISQVLNLGDQKSVKWVFGNYKRDEIREIVSKPSRGVWFVESLNFWQKMLNLQPGVSDKDALYKNP